MINQVAIVQSCYIPWKGYFDLINSVDHFILYDDVQFTKRDWRNRNKIKTSSGIIWLTLPVKVKGKFNQLIKEVKIADPQWGKKHWNIISRAYAKAPFFKDYQNNFEPLYLKNTNSSLSEINLLFIQTICNILSIKTSITTSMDYQLPSNVIDKTEKLIFLCQQVKATEYLSGPLAKDYLNTEMFHKKNIGVSFYDYSEYPEYPQLYPPFDHYVSILDLIFNQGLNATHYMKSFNHKETKCLKK